MGQVSTFDSKASPVSEFEAKIEEVCEGCEAASFSRRSSSRIRTRPAWNRALIRFGPFAGISALLLTALSIIACLGVLVGSDNSEVEQWPTPPSTYIAIFTAIANISMRFAATQGFVIAWWRNALKGSNLNQLHWAWRSGTSFRGALAAGRHMGWTGLACIFSVLVMIDGPLLQRASVVKTAPYSSPVQLNVTMLPQLLPDSTGVWWNYTTSTKYGQAAFNSTIPTPYGHAPNNVWFGSEYYGSAIKLWLEDKGYSEIIDGCADAQCKAKILAPALAQTACVSHSVPRNFTIPFPPSDRLRLARGPPFDNLAFLISIGLVVDGEQERINTVSGFSQSERCVGTFNYTICSFESAVGEYDVTIHGNITTLDSAASPRIVSIVNNPPGRKPYIDGYLSALAGVVFHANQHWNSYVVTLNIDGVQDGFSIGADSSQLFSSNKEVGDCASTTDPQNDIIASLNKLMVFYGMAMAKGAETEDHVEPKPGNYEKRTTTGSGSGIRSVFHTDFNYFLTAVTLEILCICLVVPTYWGWWNIGRSVSFSPLEIAKAFQAPILADANSNLSARSIAENYKDYPVQYGMSVVHGESKLTFASARDIASPKEGTHFDL